MPFKDIEQKRAWQRNYDRVVRVRPQEQVDNKKEWNKKYNKEHVRCECCNLELNRHSLSKHKKSKTHIANSARQIATQA